MGNNAAAEAGPVTVPRALPDFRLLHLEPDIQREQRREPADEEHRAPPPAREHEEVTERGEEIAGGVALLQQPREHAPPPGRHLLHHERRSDAPLAAHPDAEQRAKHEERPVARCETGEHLDERIEDEVEHQRQASAVAVGQ